MDNRCIGRSELTTAPIALGTSVFGWTVSEAAAFEILDRFVARGFNLIDTADVYYLWANGNRGGESETIIGNWLKSRGQRDRVTIATKIGESFGDERHGLKRDYVISGVEASLKRLQTEYIDLYQAHIDDPDTPLDETLEAFAQLIKDGKARVIGASNYEAPRLVSALQTSAAKGLPRFESFQTLYNLCDRMVYENELAPICQEEELGVLTYRSLAQGFLTGKYRDPASSSQSQRGTTAITYLNDRGRSILATVDAVAHAHGATPAQVSLAWLIARPAVAAAIVSTSRPQQMDAVLDAAGLVLSSSDMAALNEASRED